ncbi:ATP-binding cassette domain-containing protein [Flavobacterium sp. RHBU_3]|uniref:ABC transporter ATP-binding protein n=1 Tax=Flavobacterium sp. RHBU_3 TaxID=3391184 RepID=UPI003984B8D4
MSTFQSQYDEVTELLRFDDFSLVVKRIIDFTLDTEKIAFYKETATLLDWLDTNPTPQDIKQRAEALLKKLHSELISKPVHTGGAIVEGHDLRKKYSRSGFSLGPVNLSLNYGDIIGLVGENGNGKTTLLRVLCGELKPDAGMLHYHFQHSDLYELRSKLIYIPQRTQTWYGPVLENLLFAATCHGYSPEESVLVTELLIARMGLRKFRNHRWKDLSSGYKMRFELVRMLLRKPKILLIDEPLANLDIIAQQTVLEDFRFIAKSPFRPLGIVLSSQQLYEVEKTSDQVIFLKQGVQKNLKNTHQNAEETLPLVIEFESEWTQGILHEKLSTIGTVNLQFNGGTYVATFGDKATVNDFLSTVTAQNIPLTYFRDISNSTRRFFVS